MAKHSKKHKKKSFDWRLGLLIVLLVLLAAAIWLSVILSRSESPELSLDSSYQQEVQPTETNPTETNPDGSDSTVEESQAATDTEEQDPAPATEDSLPDGLRIVYMTSYAGIYMEDGSDEVVSDVMMILLENTSELDLQLARIDIKYPDFTAEFEVSSLPAGEKVVLLEKNRRSMPDEKYTSIEVRNDVFFQTEMSLMEDTFEITGGNGYLDVKNISDSATTGKVYVYYKHAASDLLYGGITFRATVNESIAPGQTVRILTKHYSADNSRILAVTCSE